jgi:hypothetical protein
MQRFLSLVAPLMTSEPNSPDPRYRRHSPLLACSAGLYGAPNVEITVVNLGSDEFDDSNLRVRHGNACQLPFVDRSFDVVHSNSVIEHVGSWPICRRWPAKSAAWRLVYFVQTPNYWFPLEPHYRLPLGAVPAAAATQPRPRSLLAWRQHRIGDRPPAAAPVPRRD